MPKKIYKKKKTPNKDKSKGGQSMIATTIENNNRPNMISAGVQKQL